MQIVSKRREFFKLVSMEPSIHSKSGSAPSLASALKNLGDATEPNHNNGEISRTRVPVKKEDLLQLLEYCQCALQYLKAESEADSQSLRDVNLFDVACDSSSSSSSSPSTNLQPESLQLCDRLKSQVDSPAFLEKLGSIHASTSKVTTERSDETTSWDIITESEILDCPLGDPSCLDQEYIVVHEEDIVDGIACFMATYISKLNQTKELSPQQLQKALSKTFSKKRSKGKLRKVWDSSKAIYNVVSWGATAVGMYQNPVLTKAASVAFWSCCEAVSKMI
eukprot:TRINITY_DN3274_c0_g1_i1.p1 TRINITY_DN3274_c0_g1~~TRINITY_DN3274_c0_g1_i1.p1  ORF type:complete len:279 (-),score=69.71 TRINITY_DN3274_c0_g1_i1:293-1129(-)